MSSLGQECTDEEIKHMIDVANKLGVGRIDLPSFLTQYQHAENEDPEEMVEEAFKLVGDAQNYYN